MNVLKYLAIAVHMNCGYIRSQYTKALVSPTSKVGLIVPTLGGGMLISHTPTSHFSDGPSSIVFASCIVNAANVLLG
jgi:hypothetical protein